MKVRHPGKKSDQRFDEATNLWLLHVCERDLQLVIGADHVVVVKVSTQGSRFCRISAHPAVKRRPTCARGMARGQ